MTARAGVARCVCAPREVAHSFCGIAGAPPTTPSSTTPPAGSCRWHESGPQRSVNPRRTSCPALRRHGAPGSTTASTCSPSPSTRAFASPAARTVPLAVSILRPEGLMLPAAARGGRTRRLAPVSMTHVGPSFVAGNLPHALASLLRACLRLSLSRRRCVRVRGASRHLGVLFGGPAGGRLMPCGCGPAPLRTHARSTTVDGAALAYEGRPPVYSFGAFGP